MNGNISIGKYISSIYRHQSILINDLFDDLDLSGSNYLFMIKINENQGCSLKDLSKIVAIDKANTSRNVKKLEALGYIYTETSASDKRARNIFLTEKGHTIIPTIIKRLQEVTKVLSDGLSEDETLLLSKLLIKAETSIVKAVADRKEAR